MKKLIIILMMISMFSLSSCDSGSKEFMRYDGNRLYAEYAIEDGKIILGKGMDNDGTINDEDKIIWDKISEIFPRKYLCMISKYEVVTDGLDGDLASVFLNDDRKTWTISVDLDDTLDDKQNFTESSRLTLIHEMAHIIALNSTQTGGDVKDKNLYTVEEGTLKRDSYLSIFYDKFWKHHMSEHSRNSEEKNRDKHDKDSFYIKYVDEFITDYAATNPVEDFAETFAFFVVLDKPEDNSIKSKKILFFYDYPEFLKIRDDIRRNIDIDVSIEDDDR